MEVDERTGKEAETHFRVLQRGPDRALIQAKPLTGRTHQIRVHLSESGHPVIGDTLYGWKPKTGGRTVTKPDPFPLALRAVELAYVDPFTRKRVHICAPDEDFLRHFGFQKTTLVSDPSAASMT
jgi:23S rRNA pseudouridine1911/1915/1917 synthase